MMSPLISARERLLQEAAQRFYANGIAATGIDGIIQGAGVAKMSLYNNFGSKAELVAAYLERRHQQCWSSTMNVWAASAGRRPGCWRWWTRTWTTRTWPTRTVR
ncbi:TetR/AcrR family transcriptional regulator, partial [Arthrobacter sp. JCM 19049]|uniref:TetR/AcrR family transcriptional regulator n=1 Tax=Arthrobacter sp. JCM 19049 TaxID=1460643 RepID=UPI002795611D